MWGNCQEKCETSNAGGLTDGFSALYTYILASVPALLCSSKCMLCMVVPYKPAMRNYILKCPCSVSGSIPSMVILEPPNVDPMTSFTT